MIRLDHDTEIMFLDDVRRPIHQHIEKNTKPYAYSWKFKEPVPIGNGLYCISGDPRSQSFSATINGKRFVGPIRIFSMAADGLITDFPYTKDEFLEMYPELKSKQTDSYPKFQLKGRCNSAFAPMACTDEQIENWKKMLDKRFTEYNVHEIVFTHRHWTYSQLKNRLGMGTDAIRDIVDECIEMYGCF